MVIDWVMLIAWLIFFFAVFLFLRVWLQTRMRMIKDSQTLIVNFLGIIALILFSLSVRFLFHG